MVKHTESQTNKIKRNEQDKDEKIRPTQIEIEKQNHIQNLKQKLKWKDVKRKRKIEKLEKMK